MSCYSVDITLRGDHCHTLGKQLVELTSYGTSTMLAIKAGHIAEFNERTIGTISTTSRVLDPAIPYTKQLQSWFHQRDILASSPSLSRKFSGPSKQGYPQRTIDNLIGSHTTRKATWFSVRGTITSIDMKYFYFLACPLSYDGIQCMKNVINHSNGMWHFTKCGGAFPECDYQYVLKFEINDHKCIL